MKGRVRFTATLVVATMAMAACGSDSPSSSSTAPTSGSTDVTTAPSTEESTQGSTEGSTEESTATTGEAAAGDDVCTADKVGGEITVTARGIGTTMDTYTSALASIQTGWEGIPVFSTLMRYDIGTREYVPQVAESLVPNADSSEWTLTLRDGVEFGNGDPLDGAAMIAFLDRHLSEESTSRLKGEALQSIASYELVDPMTVKFILTGPYGRFPFVLTGGMGMVQNVAVIDEIGVDAFATNPKGAGVGPYEVVEYSAPERIVLEAKKDWWGGPVCIEKVTIGFIPDQRANYDAYKQGEVDIMYTNRDAESLATMTEENPGQLVGQIFNAAFMVMPNLGANGYTGPLTDLRVRQAIAYAIDPEVINQRAFNGKGWTGKGLVNEASESIDATEGLEYDPAKAKALIEEYKAETGWDGSLRGIAAATPASNKEAAIVVAAQLEAIGIKVDLNADMGITQFITQVAVDKDFDLVMSWGFIADEAGLYNGLRTWGSTNPRNQNGLNSPAFDEALDGLRISANADDYQAALEAMQTVINDEVPFIIYGADRGSTLWRDNIHGIVWHNAIDPFLDTAYIAD